MRAAWPFVVGLLLGLLCVYLRKGSNRRRARRRADVIEIRRSLERAANRGER